MCIWRDNKAEVEVGSVVAKTYNYAAAADLEKKPHHTAPTAGLYRRNIILVWVLPPLYTPPSPCYGVDTVTLIKAAQLT